MTMGSERTKNVTTIVCGVRCAPDGHRWDGPTIYFDSWGNDVDGDTEEEKQRQATSGTATCSKCGAAAINVGLMEGP